MDTLLRLLQYKTQNQSLMKKIHFLLLIGISSISYCQTISLKDYFDNTKGYTLSNVFSVTSDKDILTVTGYKRGAKNSSSEKIQLEKGEVLGILSHKWIQPKISILTIPYKVRRATGSLETSAYSGLTNIGLNIGMPEIKLDRHFSNGTKSTHSLSLGILIAPTVEELNAINTNIPTYVTSKQLFLSTGLSLVYSYNNIQLSFVPVGFDFSTSTEGRKWLYDGKSWFGFGIGFDPKIFSPLLNK